MWTCKFAAAAYLLSQDQISFTVSMVCDINVYLIFVICIILIEFMVIVCEDNHVTPTDYSQNVADE